MSLPDPSREALALYYLDGLSTAEMARLLNITEAAVRQRVSRARRQLQVDGSLG
ncbi:RNA polymerase sigma factor [Candidatus Latescibacterota bacterium]